MSLFEIATDTQKNVLKMIPNKPLAQLMSLVFRVTYKNSVPSMDSFLVEIVKEIFSRYNAPHGMTLQHWYLAKYPDFSYFQFALADKVFINNLILSVRAASYRSHHKLYLLDTWSSAHTPNRVLAYPRRENGLNSQQPTTQTSSPTPITLTEDNINNLLHILNEQYVRAINYEVLASFQAYLPYLPENALRRFILPLIQRFIHDNNDYFAFKTLRALIAKLPDTELEYVGSLLIQHLHPQCSVYLFAALEILIPRLSDPYLTQLIEPALQALTHFTATEDEDYGVGIANKLIIRLNYEHLDPFQTHLLSLFHSTDNMQVLDTVLKLTRKLPDTSLEPFIASILENLSAYSDVRFSYTLQILNEVSLRFSRFYKEEVILSIYNRVLSLTIPLEDEDPDLFTALEISQQFEKLLAHLPSFSLPKLIAPILPNLRSNDPDHCFAALWLLRALLSQITSKDDLKPLIECILQLLNHNDIDIRYSAFELIEKHFTSLPIDAQKNCIPLLLAHVNDPYCENIVLSVLEESLSLFTDPAHSVLLSHLSEHLQDNTSYTVLYDYVSRLFSLLPAHSLQPFMGHLVDNLSKEDNAKEKDACLDLLSGLIVSEKFDPIVYKLPDTVPQKTILTNMWRMWKQVSNNKESHSNESRADTVLLQSRRNSFG